MASSSSVTSSRPAPRGGGQLAALGLVEAWNRLGPGLKVDTAVLGPDAWRRLRDAMRRRDLAAWETIFDTCATSDYLAGREDLPAVDLWTVIEKLADRIAAGKYRTHPAPAAVARPTALPGAEDFAAVRAGLAERRAQAAAEWAEVRAKQAPTSTEAATVTAPVTGGGPH